MIVIADIDNYLWAISIVAELALLSSLVLRRDYRGYPAFCTYILGVVLQAVLLFVAYRKWGYTSLISWRIAWGTQMGMLVLRALVVAEICHHLLGRYRGVWALTWRILLGSAGVVLLYAIVASGNNPLLILTNLQRAVELAIATSIVMLFVFARYYEIVPDNLIRSLGLGFLLLSCFTVLNDTFLERFVDRYVPLWTFLDLLAFFACVVIWGWALRQPRAEKVREMRLLSPEIYAAFVPEVNLRLRLLNERLGRFWKVEAEER
jgi:hypothetical protein